MSLNTQYSLGSYLKRAGEISAQSIVEIRFSDQEIGEVLSFYPQVFSSSCEISSGRANYGGRIICTLVYCDGDGKLCRIQKGAEFNHFADDESLAPADTGILKLLCERSQIKRDGSAWLVSVVVGAKIEVYAPAQRSFVSSAEGVCGRRENVGLYTATVFSGESEIEDDFDCNAEDVLVPSAHALVYDCNVKTGAVEVSGELFLNLLAVRGGAPVSLERIIPFKCEIACENALLSRKAACTAELKDITVNARVDEEKGKCSVAFTAVASFSGVYCEQEEATVFSDAYSCTNKLDCRYQEEVAYPATGYKIISERVSGLAATKAKLDYSCTFLATALPRAEFNRTESGAEGVITATLLYDKGGETRSTEVTLPFGVTFPDKGEADIAVCGVSVRQRAEGECEAEATLKISVSGREEVKVGYICEVEEGEPLAFADSAISVYLPSAGDDLWTTAKKLCRPPEDVEATNPELKFPLSGKERIVVYRPKTE